MERTSSISKGLGFFCGRLLPEITCPYTIYTFDAHIFKQWIVQLLSEGLSSTINHPELRVDFWTNALEVAHHVRTVDVLKNIK